MPESDQLTIIFGLLALVLGVSTFYLAIRSYHESSRKKRYMGEVLLSIQSIMTRLQSIDEVIRTLSTINDDSDADMDLSEIEDDIMRAHFDLKSDNFTLHFRVLEIIPEKGANQPYDTNVGRIGEMLNRREIRSFNTKTDIEGATRTAGNSPTFHELLWMHIYLLEIMAEVERFKEAYESLGPDLIELVRATAETFRDMITDCARDRDVQVDLVSLGNSEALHAYLFEEFLSIKKIKAQAPQIQKITETIQNVRKELFRISYLQP
jgi:hypothetical protein